MKKIEIIVNKTIEVEDGWEFIKVASEVNDLPEGWIYKDSQEITENFELIEEKPKTDLHPSFDDIFKQQNIS